MRIVQTTPNKARISLSKKDWLNIGKIAQFDGEQEEQKGKVKQQSIEQIHKFLDRALSNIENEINFEYEAALKHIQTNNDNNTEIPFQNQEYILKRIPELDRNVELIYDLAKIHNLIKLFDRIRELEHRFSILFGYAKAYEMEKE